MKQYIIILAVILTACTEQSSHQSAETEGPLTSLENRFDSLSYAIGVSFGANMASGGMDTINKMVFAEGMAAGLSGNTDIMDARTGQAVVQQHFAHMQKMESAKSAQKSKQFLEANKSLDGVIVLPSGLQYKVLTQGSGPSPTLNDRVLAHYVGTLPNGTTFDSSRDKGEPVIFAVTGVIRAWTEALQMMKVGSRWMLYVPSELGYGEKGGGGAIGPNQVLIFDVELLEINPSQ